MLSSHVMVRIDEMHVLKTNILMKGKSARIARQITSPITIITREV